MAKEAWREALKDRPEALQWFDNPKLRLKTLVLVLDEVTNLGFARFVADHGQGMMSLSG